MRLSIFFLAVVIFSCSKQSPDVSQEELTLFTKLSSGETGIAFQNALQIQEDFDVFRYRNYYNGGGVAIGDINNDGLADIYLTSNMGDNKLYLNKGNWKFEDITVAAGVAGTKAWSTGVAMADVNADGLLDIYVCNSGDIKGYRRENELFINNGDNTFTESAHRYGLDDIGFSTHAVFFDYDNDGDLDCYLLNNSFRPIGTLGYRNLRHERDKQGGDKLFRNDDGFFVDVSEEAGIFGSVIGFGLGVCVGDVNGDNYPDIYVANDFYERDYLYINNKDGTFREELPDRMGHISMFSMGTDLADINNDGHLDIFSTDMLPEDDVRLKTLTAFEAYDVYQLRLKNDYYHQFMRNMLQLNNGDGTFVEIGQMAGVEATDWSWSALIADFTNSGHKEIFVTNGIYKDLIDQDFLEFMANDETIREAMEGKKIDFSKFVDKMPSKKLSNYMFTHSGQQAFKNMANAWGLAEPSFSNGAAYGDLDNDGDLDLVVNNLNQETFIYRNNAEKLIGNNYLTVTFRGDKLNPFGVGAKVKVFTGDNVIYHEHIPNRAFQSSMDYKMVIGLGQTSAIDSLIVTWPNAMIETQRKLAVNKQIELNIAHAKRTEIPKVVRPVPFMEEVVDHKINFAHTENEFNDFDRERLLYRMLSTEGPALAVGDLNNDGLDDFYIGGAKEQSGAVFIQQGNGTFVKLKTSVFEADSLAEDVDAVFFDADGDGDLDLYVVSGGNEFDARDLSLQDRLYINQSSRGSLPVFEKSNGKLPGILQSGSCVRVHDFNGDGHPDLFVGSRVIPRYYGLPVDQYLLQNDGNGNFTDVTKTSAPELLKLGMVTDAQWADYDGDGNKDLVVVGEWMPVTIFRSDGKTLTKVVARGLENTSGWWNSLYAVDLDGDGNIDFVAGNHGLNSRFKASVDSPLSLYVNDFDQNGSIEPIYAFESNGKEFPMTMKQDLVKQMSSMKKKFLYYRDYAGKTMEEVFEPELLAEAHKSKAVHLATSVLRNDGKGNFEVTPLPWQAQVAPVYAIEVTDVNHDGHLDIILGGNLFAVKPEAGRYDGLQGLVLLGDGRTNFNAATPYQSGLKLPGETRNLRLVRGRKFNFLLAARNNNSVKLFRVK